MANNWQETNDPTNTSNSFSSTTKQYSNNYQTMKSDDENEEVKKKERTHCFVLYDSQNFSFLLVGNY